MPSSPVDPVEILIFLVSEWAGRGPLTRDRDVAALNAVWRRLTLSLTGTQRAELAAFHEELAQLARTGRRRPSHRSPRAASPQSH